MLVHQADEQRDAGRDALGEGREEPFPAVDQPVFPNYPPTLGNVISDSASRYGDRVFLSSKAGELTFADVDRQTLEWASGLLTSGVGKGTRVAILIGNSPNWVLAWLAAGRIGAFTIPVSTLFQPREIAWLLKYADIDTVLMEAEYAGHNYLERLERSVPGIATSGPDLALAEFPFVRRIYVWAPPEATLPPWARRGPEDLLAATQRAGIDGSFAKCAEANVTPSDWLIGVCTSGTTSEPKIVIHTHGSAIRTTYSHRPYRRRNPELRDLAGMPFFWLGGINGHVIPALYEGNRLVFPSSPATEDILEAIRRESITRIALFPARRDALREAAVAQAIDISDIEGIAEPRFADGSVISPELRGPMLLGMTETFGPHGVKPLDEPLPESKAQTVGHSIVGIERRVVDVESGEELPPGEVGELQVRGYSLMQGYYKRERGDEFTSDGWFRTGDLCHFDEDGYLYFDNRHSDMIKTMGANVSPREVEVLMESYPEVREAIVLGVPDDQRGERVVAVVIPATDATVRPEKLQAQMKGEISSYKVPSEIVVASFDDVPRTDAGKPRKNLLRECLPTLRHE
jgi:acyl-CoA synthetase (AMP-forming)/AMP-acid ligase II